MALKVVNYRRRKFTVPDWALWITTDANGEVKVHVNEPTVHPFSPEWFSNGKISRLTLVIDNKCTINYPEWENSKRYLGGKGTKKDKNNLQG